jgi:hypothetical protein
MNIRDVPDGHRHNKTKHLVCKAVQKVKRLTIGPRMSVAAENIMHAYANGQ